MPVGKGVDATTIQADSPPVDELEADNIVTSGIEPSHVDLSKREFRRELCDTEAGQDTRLRDVEVDDAWAEVETSQAAWSTQAALFAIRFYQRCVSPFTPPSCRFHPSCSHYAYGSIRRFGLWRGGWMGLKRICKCHPFHPGGYDPVPELETNTRPSNTRQMSTRETNARNEHKAHEHNAHVEPLENRHLI